MVSNRLLVREKETSQHGDILLPAKDHGSPGISLPFTNRNLIRLYLISFIVQIAHCSAEVKLFRKFFAEGSVLNWWLCRPSFPAVSRTNIDP